MNNIESTPASMKNSAPGFLHTVFFWLKNPAYSTERQRFETSLKKFIDSSRFIKTRHIGVPAKTDRSVIDQSYTYCLSLTFYNRKKMYTWSLLGNQRYFGKKCWYMILKVFYSAFHFSSKRQIISTLLSQILQILQ
jgi:hypothetical protein